MVPITGGRTEIYNSYSIQNTENPEKIVKQRDANFTIGTFIHDSDMSTG